MPAAAAQQGGLLREVDDVVLRVLLARGAVTTGSVRAEVANVAPRLQVLAPGALARLRGRGLVEVRSRDQVSWHALTPAGETAARLLPPLETAPAAAPAGPEPAPVEAQAAPPSSTVPAGSAPKAAPRPRRARRAPRKRRTPRGVAAAQEDRILARIRELPGIAPRDLMRGFPATRRTLTALLGKLLRTRAIRREGRTRGTRYYAASKPGPAPRHETPAPRRASAARARRMLTTLRAAQRAEEKAERLETDAAKARAAAATARKQADAAWTAFHRAQGDETP